MSQSKPWRLVGEWFDNCSCAIPCPCTFAQPADNDYCEYVLFWRVSEGHYGDIDLSGLSMVKVGRYDGDLWAATANGVSGFYIDERADDAQADALFETITGQHGGFPAVIRGQFAAGRKVVGIERAKIDFELAPDQSSWGVEIAGKVKAWAKALVGPTSNPGKFPQLANAPGSETGPGPQLVTWGKSTVCEVDAFGFNLSWTTNSSKHIPFNWEGP